MQSHVVAILCNIPTLRPHSYKHDSYCERCYYIASSDRPGGTGYNLRYLGRMRQEDYKFKACLS